MTPPPRPHFVRLYPEIGQAGSLQTAIQTALDHAGYELTALLTSSPGWWDCATWVDNGNRHVSIVLGSQERWFLMEFWERGVRMADGKTTDLAAAAGATGLWQTGSRLRELQAAWPFVRYGKLAEAYEHGNPVETKWEIYRQSQARHIDHDLIEAAYAQPKLRELFPFTSHATLHLSRCARYPFTADLPAITPVADGTYEVAWPTDSPYGSGTVGRADTPQDAIALVTSHLPDNYGHAVDATAKDGLDKTDST
ncbi:DUF6193 family natural product biosynthesis protein [Allorhizocola rhizosphaerae]|uniref:DUF6193 family natural product biosynthesis protein n=1 Tax=Allorhizocola rhizosphaerae TaxID=1872709 RepID=UPI0013C2AEA0|nr:DUF6193 family natural product biosynthesis protein [Allorhizocola rhizosphaerae]